MAKKMSGMRETPPNWLSDLIKPIWDKHYWIRWRRTSAIVAAITKHPKGKALKSNPGLEDAVRHGLEEAEKRQHELEENPKLMTGSPSHRAAEVIAERLNISLT